MTVDLQDPGTSLLRFDVPISRDHPHLYMPFRRRLTLEDYYEDADFVEIFVEG